ncbi:MAG TPA: hypothetical protein VN673_09630 [Clostridia bacterium]|nr:hypothetical protein [Clostridia bacterium]
MTHTIAIRTEEEQVRKMWRSGDPTPLGFVAQEFMPKRPDALASLRQGVQIWDV